MLPQLLHPQTKLWSLLIMHCLGITDRGQILTRFFQRNSTKAGELTLHPQHVDDFGCGFIPGRYLFNVLLILGMMMRDTICDLNVEFIEVKLSETLEGKVDRDGQKEMFVQSSSHYRMLQGLNVQAFEIV